MRVLKLQQVNGDGSSAVDTTFVFHPDIDRQTGQPFCDAAGKPWVELTLRPVTKEKHRECIKAHTTLVANGSGVMDERIDWEAVNDDVAAYAIVAWRGFVGADDKPLACIDVTKRALDTLMKNEVRSRVLYAQPAEVAAASF